MKGFRDKRLWIVISVTVLVMLAFIDRNSIKERSHLREQIRELEQQRDYYLEKIAEDSITIENLKDDAFLEKFARENYLIKRDGDHVFVIED